MEGPANLLHSRGLFRAGTEPHTKGGRSWRKIPSTSRSMTASGRGAGAGVLRSGRLGVRPLPPDHGVRGHMPGDRAGPDAAAARAAHQDRSPRCAETGPPVAGGGADSDPRTRRGGGSRPRPGAVSRGRAARCRALAASVAEVARSARPALGDGEELDAAALELDPGAA